MVVATYFLASLSLCVCVCVTRTFNQNLEKMETDSLSVFELATEASYHNTSLNG